MAIDHEKLFSVLSASFLEAVENPDNKVFRPFLYFPRSLQDWLEKPISMTHFFERFSRWSEERLDIFFSELLESPTFAAMLEQCPDLHDVPITFRTLRDMRPSLADAGGMYSAKENKVVINVEHTRSSNDTENEKEFIDHFHEGFPSPMHRIYIIHELRHAYHRLSDHIHPYGVANNVEQALANSFLQEAEVNAFQATVCWELNRIGMPEYWNAYCLHSPELARAFQDSVDKNFSNALNGKAQQAVFMKWLESQSKVDFYTNNLIQRLKERSMSLHPLKDVEGYKQDKVSQPSHLREKSPFGLMPMLIKGEIYERVQYLSEDGIVNSDDFVIRNVQGPKFMEAKLAFEGSLARNKKDATKIAAIENLTI